MWALLAFYWQGFASWTAAASTVLAALPRAWAEQHDACFMGRMLEIVVRYLHGAAVPFVLSSYPDGLEPTAHRVLPHGAMLVETQLVLVDGRLAVVCYPHGESVDMSAVGAELGGMAIETTPDALPEDFRRMRGSVPPLGQLFGVPVILDERVSEAVVLVFRVFDGSDYFDVPYDDFARLESPRLASFASAGELEASTVRVPRAGSRTSRPSGQGAN